MNDLIHKMLTKMAWDYSIEPNTAATRAATDAARDDVRKVYGPPTNQLRMMPTVVGQRDPYDITTGEKIIRAIGLRVPIVVAGVSAGLILHWLLKNREDEKLNKQASVHIPEVAAGTAVGAGAGLLLSLLRKKRSKGSLLRDSLIGAAAGGLAGQGLGHIGRRYITNTISPVGYDVKDKLKALKPTLSKLWNAGVMDRPQESVYSEKGVSKEMTDARKELFRRGLGVHAEDPKTDAFTRSNDGKLRFNINNPTFEEYMKDLRDSASGIKHSDIFGRVSSKPLGQGHKKVTDSWGFELEPSEERLYKSIGAKTTPEQVQDARNKTYYYSALKDMDEGSISKSMQLRKLLANKLVYDPPVVEEVISKPVGG